MICSLLMEEVVYFVGAESGVRSGQQSVHQCAFTLASLGTKLLFQLLSSQISAKYTYLPYSWPLCNYEIIPVLRTWFFLPRFISHKLITYITGIKKKPGLFREEPIRGSTFKEFIRFHTSHLLRASDLFPRTNHIRGKLSVPLREKNIHF